MAVLLLFLALPAAIGFVALIVFALTLSDPMED